MQKVLNGLCGIWQGFYVCNKNMTKLCHYTNINAWKLFPLNVVYDLQRKIVKKNITDAIERFFTEQKENG